MRATLVSLGLWLSACGSSAPTATSDSSPASGTVSLAPSNSERAAKLTPREAIDAAAAYLLRHIDEKGRFDYLRRSSAPDADYNVLRHAGSIYSLLQYYQRRPSEPLKAGILRASAYLRTRYLRAPGPEPELLAVFSRADEESVRKPTAKLGGAALGLIALCGAHTLEPSSVSRDELAALGRFIAFMQKPSGGFHSKYTEDGGYDTSFQSLYYPGEAMLALSTLYDLDENPHWLEVALRSAHQLVESRKTTSGWPADHWMMLSSAPLLARYAALPETPPISAQAFAAHIEALGTIIMDDQDPERGSFGAKARSTPAATRLEGLLALLHTQMAADAPDARLLGSIRAGLAFLMECQIRDGSAEHGGMPRNCEPRGKKRDREVRIDYVQHYLSAMIAAEALGLFETSSDESESGARDS